MDLKHIKIFHQNIEHLPSRLDSLKIVLEEIDPDFCVITEHNVKSCEIDRINLANYKIISYYCRETARKGGVMVFCKTSIKNAKMFVLPAADKLCEDRQFEFCSIKCKFNKFELILIGLYRSPSSDVTEFFVRLNKLIEIMLTKTKHILIIGDVNINVLVDSNQHTELKNVLKRNGLAYFVNFPTRVTTNSQTAIDNVFSNLDKSKINVSGVVTFLSDHDGQVVELINLQNPDQNKKQITEWKRNFSKENVKTFSFLLQRENWLDVYLANPEIKYETFYGIFKYYFDLSFNARKIKKIHKHNEWLTDELKQENFEINRELKTARQSNNRELYSKTKNKHKMYKKKLLARKKMYYDNKIAKSKNVAKTTWGIINSEVGKHKDFKSDISLNFNGVKYADPKNVSNIFCNYFSNFAAAVKNHSCTHQYSDPNLDTNCRDFLFRPTFHLTPTNEKEVENVIGKLKPKNSVGFDEIPVSILKLIKKQISKVLSHLINSSFVAGNFPYLLKISKVVPVYKKGCTKDMTNYRPISILSNVSKIYEKIVYNRLIEFLEVNNLINKVQHGFRPNKSVITAAVSLIESIIESVDRGDETIGIFMDLSKAFDCVEHNLLLTKLSNLGIKGNSLNFIQSYLKGRNQYVEMKEITETQEMVKIRSDLKQMKYGVPQGSILGPLLFLCYINNISEVLTGTNNNHLSLYADDSNLKVSAKSINQLETVANLEMKNINSFFNSCRLFLNVDKTKFVRFSTKQTTKLVDPNILVNSFPIDQVNDTNFLGLKIDRFLSWEEHIRHVVKKVNSGVYALRQMSFISDVTTLKTLYHALIQSHIHFGLSLYGSTTKSNLDKLLILQKKSIRIILHLKQNESVKAHFKNLGILTIYSLYIYECICIFKNSQRDSLHKLEHPYNTRHKLNIVTDHHNLEFYRKKPNYMGRKFMQFIPNNIQAEMDAVKFKKNLKKYMLNLCLYSVEEFCKTN